MIKKTLGIPNMAISGAQFLAVSTEAPLTFSSRPVRGKLVYRKLKLKQMSRQVVSRPNISSKDQSYTSITKIYTFITYRIVFQMYMWIQPLLTYSCLAGNLSSD